MTLPEFEGLETLRVSIEDRIAHVALCRGGDLNTLTPAFWREFPAVIRAIDDRAAARVIVLSGDGRHFTAGMDLGVLAGLDGGDDREPARAGERMRNWVLGLQRTFNALEQARMPVLAAVQGACVGGGVDMICAADSRYCTEDAWFSVKETQLGMAADLGTLQRLPRLIPQGLARELVYTGRKLEAAEAASCGFVNRVFPTREGMLEEVMAVAAEIAANSPLAVTGSKEMLNFSREHPIAESLRYMATWQAGMLKPRDLSEALTAAREKRAPEFEDLWPRESAVADDR